MRGSNFKGDLRKKRLSERPQLVVGNNAFPVAGSVPAERLERPSVDGDRGAEDRAVARRTAPRASIFSNSTLEAVARLQVGVEVHLAAEHVGQLQRELRSSPRRASIDADERRVRSRRCARRSPTTSICLSYCSTCASSASGLRAIEIDDAQEAIGVDLILELAQQPVERSHEAVRPVGAQLARIEDAARGRRRPR